MLEASGYLYMWVLKIRGIQNLIAQSLKILELSFSFSQILWQLNFAVFKFVGTQIKINMWVLKSVDIMKYQIL